MGGKAGDDEGGDEGTAAAEPGYDVEQVGFSAHVVRTGVL